jgi:hypothetical protein
LTAKPARARIAGLDRRLTAVSLSFERRFAEELGDARSGCSRADQHGIGLKPARGRIVL